MLDLQDILHRVALTEGERQGWRTRCEYWRQMWRLEAFKESRQEALKDKREQIILSLPYDVIRTATTLVPARPIIECPEAHDEMTEGNKEARQQFLIGLWERNNRRRKANLWRDMGWFGATSGRYALEVKWIYESLPVKMRGRVCPIYIETIDPLQVGIKDGPFWTEYAYRKYMCDRADVRQRYPNARFTDDRYLFGNPASMYNRGYQESTMSEVIDFWYTDPKTGTICNAIIVDQSFVKRTAPTDYISIPLIEGGMDRAPLKEERWKYNSILRGIDQTWQYQSALASQIATGLMYHFWPAWITQNEFGKDIGDIKMGPGQTKSVPWGTKVDQLMGNVNVPLADAMLNLLENQAKRTTFPDPVFGMRQGSAQAGYDAQNMLAVGAANIDSLLESISLCASAVNEIAFGFVESFAQQNGVSVWGYNQQSEQYGHMTLYPEQINGYYENNVRVEANLPHDDLQKLTLWLRLVETGIMSQQTFREKGMAQRLPINEFKRVIFEQALRDPQLAPFIREVVMGQYFNDPYWREGMGIPPMMNPTDMMQGAGATAQQQPPMLPGGGMGPAMGGMPGGGMPGFGSDVMPPQMQGMMTEDTLQLPPNQYQFLANGRSPSPVPPMDELRQMTGAF